MEGLSFRLLGFPVNVGQGAFILAGVIVLFGMADGGIVGSLVFVAVAFASLLVHELGHALAARAFRLEPIEITLHGLGGFTRHRRPDRAWKSLLVSLAGPGAGFLLVPLGLAGTLAGLGGLPADVAWALMWVNIAWGVFNLLPLFPMDGGQALLAVLSMVIPARAVAITAATGLVGGVALAIGALWAGWLWTVFVLGMIVVDNWRLLSRAMARVR